MLTLTETQFLTLLFLVLFALVLRSFVVNCCIVDDEGNEEFSINLDDNNDNTIEEEHKEEVSNQENGNESSMVDLSTKGNNTFDKNEGSVIKSIQYNASVQESNEKYLTDYKNLCESVKSLNISSNRQNLFNLIRWNYQIPIDLRLLPTFQPSETNNNKSTSPEKNLYMELDDCLYRLFHEKSSDKSKLAADMKDYLERMEILHENIKDVQYDNKSDVLSGIKQLLLTTKKEEREICDKLIALNNDKHRVKLEEFLSGGQIEIDDKYHRKCFKAIKNDNYPEKTDADYTYRFLDNYLFLIYENDASTNRIISTCVKLNLNTLESLGFGIYYIQYENKLSVNLGLIKLLEQANKYTTDQTELFSCIKALNISSNRQNLFNLIRWNHQIPLDLSLLPTFQPFETNKNKSMSPAENLYMELDDCLYRLFHGKSSDKSKLAADMKYYLEEMEILHENTEDVQYDNKLHVLSGIKHLLWTTKKEERVICVKLMDLNNEEHREKLEKFLRLGEFEIDDKYHRECFKAIEKDNYPEKTDADYTYRFLDNYLFLIYRNQAWLNEKISSYLKKSLCDLESLRSKIYYIHYENKLSVHFGLIKLLDQASKYITDQTAMSKSISRVSGS